MTTRISFSILSLFVANSVLWAQGNPVPQRITAAVRECEETVTALDKNASILILLTIGVVVLGLLVSGLQPWKSRRWMRLTGFILGLAIGAITATINTAFDTSDIKALRRSASEGHRLLRSIRWKVEDYREMTEATDRLEVEQTIRQLTDKILEMRDQLAPSKQVAGQPPWLEFDLARTVYAQSVEPGWVRQSPRKAGRIFFVGTGSAGSLAEARRLSYNDALAKAASDLRKRAPEEAKASHPESLKNYIESNAKIEETDYTRSQSGAKRSYKYFTLLSIDIRDFAPEFVRVFIEKPKVVIPSRRLEQRHIALLGEEFQGRVAVYVGDIHASTPYPVLVFERDASTSAWTESQRIGQDRVNRIPAARQLVKSQVSGKASVDFRYGGRPYTLVASTKSALIHDTMEFSVVTYAPPQARR